MLVWVFINTLETKRLITSSSWFILVKVRFLSVLGCWTLQKSETEKILEGVDSVLTLLTSGVEYFEECWKLDCFLKFSCFIIEASMLSRLRWGEGGVMSNLGEVFLWSMLLSRGNKIYYWLIQIKFLMNILFVPLLFFEIILWRNHFFIIDFGCAFSFLAFWASF